MKLIYEKNLCEIDTSESDFGSIIKSNNFLVVPYINLGVYQHELNRSTQMKRINYCYVVAIELLFLKINSDIIIDKKGEYEDIESIYLGGNDLIGNQNVFDIEFKAKTSFLQLVESSQIRDEYWIPVSTPNFPPNMEYKLVDEFINNRNLPDNIKRIIGGSG